MFRLKLFGSASIEGADGPLTGRAVQRRRLALLALLALARDRGVMRDKLIGYLWPDADAERARHLLSDSVYRINQAVAGEAELAMGDDLRLNPQRLPADAWEFTAAIEQGDWRRAVELHAAPFLDGFFLTDAEELAMWPRVSASQRRWKGACGALAIACASSRNSAMHATAISSGRRRTSARSPMSSTSRHRAADRRTHRRRTRCSRGAAVLRRSHGGSGGVQSVPAGPLELAPPH